MLLSIRTFRVFFITLFCIALQGTAYAQVSELRGVVTDSLQNPVPYTNIIATPLAEGSSITFAISDEQGRFRLELTKEIPYILDLTHLGFSKLTDTLSISEDSFRNFILFESTDDLEEVIIETELAVIVKQDTIVYRTDQFRTGEERKLREILKKLPGVEVDRAGNVTVNGKKVTKLLVEGKTFFTGDTKMGVNNIPADAVDEVVALDNYTEVAFLKGLSDSDQLALNIKLKEGKKEFAFGEIEAGAGIEERYLVHPTLFYYSPRTAVNVIGDFNNIGEMSFTLRDYMDFEGGVTAMMENPSAIRGIFSSDFARFLSQSDFIYSKNDFLAGSISHQLTSATTLDAYSIYSKGKLETLNSSDIRYLTEGGFDEFRETSSRNKLAFSLSKIKLRYQPDSETDLSFNSLVKTSAGDAYHNILSQTAQEDYNTRSLEDPQSLELIQNFSLNKQFSYEHTSTLTGSYQFSDNENSSDWLFDRALFSELIPFVDEGQSFNLLQETNSRGHHANLNLKHYWVLNNLNHIYPEVGLDFFSQTYGTLDYQRLQDGSTNDFLNSGFNNEVDFRLLDFYGGFEYKVKKGKFVFKPGIMFHNYRWRVAQFEVEQADKTKSVLLPELEVEWEPNSVETFKLRYGLNSNFANASQLANRLRLSAYNQLYRGSVELENEVYHSASLTYSQFNMYRGLFLNAYLGYTHRLETIQNASIIEGIDRISMPVYTSLPEKSYSVNASAAKQLSKFKFTISANASIAEYSRSVNEEFHKYNSETYGYRVKAETRFKEWPNLELGVGQRFSSFKSEILSNEFMQLDPFAALEYDFLKDFILKVDYTFNYYENASSGAVNRFQMGNASLFYGREDSLWAFEVEAQNIFDVRYRNSNSFSQFLVTDQNIFIQPRTVMLKVMYKL